MYRSVRYGENLCPGQQCVYSVEVSLLDLSKIILLADPLPKNPKLKQVCKASGFLTVTRDLTIFLFNLTQRLFVFLLFMHARN